MLGSLTEADDAVQETWLRLNDADATIIENLGLQVATPGEARDLLKLKGRDRAAIQDGA